MQTIISVQKLTKTYASGFQALKNVDLDIRRGEILALLGPNGAGKTTLINVICGIVNPTSGTILADGHDIASDYRRNLGVRPPFTSYSKGPAVARRMDGEKLYTH